MARSKSPRLPKLCHHKPTGQGYVRLDGRCVYLGRYDGPACQERYLAVTREWLSAGKRLSVAPDTITLSELMAAYWAFVLEYYPESGKSRDAIKQALKPLRSAPRGRVRRRKYPHLRRERQRHLNDWAAQNTAQFTRRLPHCTTTR